MGFDVVGGARGRARVGRCGPRDLGLAHAGGADHEDVLGDDLVAERLLELHPAPAVALRGGGGGGAGSEIPFAAGPAPEAPGAVCPEEGCGTDSAAGAVWNGKQAGPDSSLRLAGQQRIGI